MKKVIFTLFSACVLTTGAFAQFCGTSGSSVCSPSGTLTEPGLSPNSQDLPPVIIGQATNQTIQFKNFNQFSFSGQNVTVQSLRIDTISNIPAGLCWATNKTNNTFANQEDGCIQVSGTSTGPAGQYKLYIVVTANIGVPIQTNADAAGLKYYVRAITQGAPLPCVDTNVTATYVAYTGNEAACPSSIGNVTSKVSSINVVPNPFSSNATVSFYSEKSGTMTERITNMLGAVVYSNQLDVKAGENTVNISRNGLNTGVYFYTITDGKSVATKRIVISE